MVILLYDSAGNLRFIVTYPLVAGQTQPCKEEFQYDARGRGTQSISANGFATQFFYDDPITGLVTEIQRPAHAQREKFEYDVMGNTDKRTLPEGGETDLELDGLYRVKKHASDSFCGQFAQE